MRTRSLLAPSLAAFLVLGGCTSGEEPLDPTPTETAGTDDSAVTTGVPQGPTANGYLCRYLGPDQLAALGGGDPAEPLQVDVQDDPTHWVCEARDGEETLARVSILLGEDLAAAERETATSAEGVQSGPDYLGESYVSARRVSGLTRCHVPDGQGSTTWGSYTMVIEALGESDEDLSKHLLTAAGAAASSLDQAVGCSPKLARSEAESATTAP